MKNNESPILDAKGMPIQKPQGVMVVKYINSADEEFTFPMEVVREDEIAKETPQGIRPGDLLKEIAAVGREMRQRFTLLAAGIVLAAKSGPEELESYLNQVGLVIEDARGKKFFEAKDTKKDTPVE